MKNIEWYTIGLFEKNYANSKKTWVTDVLNPPIAVASCRCVAVP